MREIYLQKIIQNLIISFKYNLFFTFIILLFYTDLSASCDSNVPSFNVDLTGQPGGTWESPFVQRVGNCCSTSNPDRCVEFVVTLDESAEAISFDIIDGAIPNGALFFQLDCGVESPLNTPICVSGIGPHIITFCKPGNNENIYSITSIPKPELSSDIIINEGCTGEVYVTGLINSSINWRTLSPGMPSDFDDYLSCLTNCDTVIVQAQAGYPPFIDIEVSGTPSGSCSPLSFTDTTRVFFVPELFVDIGPENASVCYGDSSVELTASGTGGSPPYRYYWSNGDSTSSINAIPGTYWVTLFDESDCPPVNDTIEVIGFDSTIESNAGVNHILCAGDSTIQLNGLVGGVSTGIWLNGNGTFAPNNETLDAIYQPSDAEFQSGQVFLYLETTNNGTCDPVSDTVNIEILNFEVENYQATICQGEVYEMHGFTYANTGIYNDTLFHNSGCDSIVFTVDLVIDSFEVETYNSVICQGEVFEVHGFTYTNTGIYNDTLFHNSGCDSIVFTVDLVIDSFEVETYNPTICQGEVFEMHGFTYGATGTYNDTLFHASGCDSIVFIVDLVIDSFEVETYNPVICQGEVFEVHGFTYANTGIYNDTLFHNSGCDSIVFTVDLVIDSFEVETYNSVICQGEVFEVHGFTYTNTGIYNDTLFHNSGCDSIVFTVDLVIDSFEVETYNPVICQGETYEVHGFTYANTGIYNDTLFHNSGCDSIVFTVDLVIDSFEVETYNSVICQGEVFEVHGFTYTNTGIYNDTLFHNSGCDSIVFTVDLVIDSFEVETYNPTICQGEVFEMYGFTYTNTGIYNDTLFHTSGCDSIVFTVDLVIDSFEVETYNPVICQGEVFEMHGFTYTNTGTYNDTLFHNSGCDSIVFTVDLVIDSFEVENHQATICQGEVFEMHGFTYTNTGIYNDTLFYNSGCDSIVFTVDLVIDSFEVETYNPVICQGEIFEMHGFTYGATGIYNDTLFHTSGCDSIVFTVDLVIDSFEVETYNPVICQGEVFEVHGFTYGATGIYNDTLFHNSGCDSIVFTVDLVIDSFEVETYSPVICQGEVFEMHGFTYTNTGIYNDTLFHTSGCDSIVFTVDLVIDSFEVENYQATICQGETYEVHGFTYGSTGIYNDTLFHNSGCDSIVFTVDLVIDSFEVENYEATICQGEVFEMHGFTYGATGIYNDTLFHNSGCDSIVFTVDLVIDSFEVETYSPVICQGEVYEMHGFTYGATGVYNDTLFHNSGCDSIVFTVDLVVDSFEVENYQTTICQGEVFEMHGFTYTNTGIYNDTLFHNSGCDSIVFTVDLVIDSFEVETYNPTICQGEVFEMHGFTYGATGTYNDTLFHNSGCDSIVFTVDLVIDSFEVETYNPVICQGETYEVHGFTYANTGIYNDTLFHTSGCDSIVFTVDLVIDSFEVENYQATICQGETYEVHGFTYATTGTYNDTLFHNSGCDNIVFTVDLVIDSFEVETYSPVICQGEVFEVHGYTYTNTGIYNDTLFHNSGCDSIVFTVDLVIDSFEVETYSPVICQDEVFEMHGFTYGATGIYNDTLFHNSGCDSIVFTVDLVIDSFEVENYQATICQGETYEVHGFTYGATGTYNDTLFHTSGCDSIVFTVDLVIDSFEVENYQATICQGETYEVHGFTYTTTGIYNDTLFHNSGCDSIVFTVDLVIDSFEVENYQTTICQGEVFEMHGFTYTNTGIYKDTLFNTNGCDSILFTVDLLIDSFEVENYQATICQGETYEVHGFTYGVTGTYNDTLFHQGGCDSIVFTVDLVIDSFQVENYQATICQGVTYEVHGFTYEATGTYNDTLFHQNGCDSIVFTVDLVIDSFEVENYQATICQGETFEVHGFTYAATGIYNDTLYHASGCDSIVFTVDLTVKLTPNHIHQAFICSNESYTLPDGSTVNQTGTYVVVLPSSLGCDSTVTTHLTVNELGVVDPLDDQTICELIDLEISINTQNIVSYEWFKSTDGSFSSLSTDPNYIGATTDNLAFDVEFDMNGQLFRVEMEDMCGNEHVEEFTLNINTAPELEEEELIRYCEGEENYIVLEHDATDYVWDDGSVGAVYLPTSSGIYEVSFTDIGTGCRITQEIEVLIEDCTEDCEIIIPTAFSPDNNGVNDLYRIINTCDEDLDYFEFRIFNRWGELVYFTDNPKEGWDGIYQGINAPLAVYVYHVEYRKINTDKIGSLKGNVTLIR